MLAPFGEDLFGEALPHGGIVNPGRRAGDNERVERSLTLTWGDAEFPAGHAVWNARAATKG